LSRSLARRALLALAASCLPALLSAAETVDDGLRRCANEHEQTKRLACFDALASSLPKIEADRIGLTADIKHQRDPVAVEEAKHETLSGKIVGLRQAPRGEYIFTLDNQQVWKQAEARANIQFAVGEAVHIEHGAMSSLWLAADKNRKVRVTRLQ
jgi:hypothetical protein